jgi:hypothetical protein
MPSEWLGVFGGEMLKFIINLGVNDLDWKSSKKNDRWFIFWSSFFWVASFLA